MTAERRWFLRARRCLLALLIVGVGAAAAGAGSLAAPVDDLIPDLQVRLSAPFTPTRLPARRPSPVRLSLVEQVEALSGDHPPALQQLDVDLDRHLGLSVKGLPVCPGPLNESGPRTGSPPICEDSKIGSGSIEVDVAYPEQQPLRTSGDVIVYNGGVAGGRIKIWVYAYISAPVTGAILIPLQVRREDKGPYGWRGTLTVPKIANGYGSLTELKLRFRKGIFSAACPTGMLQTRGASRFVDGQARLVTSVQSCRTAAASG